MKQKSPSRPSRIGPSKMMGSRNTLTQLHRIVQQVSRAPDLDKALHIIVTGVRETMGADVCSVYLTDLERGYHLLMASDGLSQAVVGRLKLELDEGLVGLVAERSEPVNERNAPAHPRYRYVSDAGEEAYYGFLGVPIVHQSELLGVLVAQQAVRRRFKESEVAFLVTLAAQLAGGIALARARSALTGESPAKITGPPYVEGGVGAPGVAMGTAVVICSAAEPDQVPDRPAGDVDAEIAAFRSAVDKVSREFEGLGNSLDETLPAEDRALFEAYAMIARSDELVETTVSRIQEGDWAPGALRKTIQEHAQLFENMEDPYLRERANDIRDIGRRLLAQLFVEDHTEVTYPEQTILVGDNLSPLDLAAVPTKQLQAVISGHGSSLSHLAILARSLGIPAVMGVTGDLPVAELDSKALIVDGYQGRIYVEPGNVVKREFMRLMRQERELSKNLQRLRDLPATTPDGCRIALYTNIGLLSDLSHSQSVGSEGIGLYRSEFPFMIRNSFPTEEEQYGLYRQVLEAFAPLPVTLRTLDIGGDKPLPYFPMQEPNPFLGWRGIRISLDHPEIFLIQIRAALRAGAELGNLNLLLPMISCVEDLDQAIALIHRAHQQLTAEGANVTIPRLGAMIEVPAAVYQVEALARRVDFLSVGTNDLTQYLLAVDRNNERVAKWFSALHPAVISALMRVVEAGRQYGKAVGVCGEAAGDPAMALLLLGMGVDSLSLSAGDLPRIKWLVRSVSQKRCRELLDQALTQEKAIDITELLRGALLDSDLGGLVRAGR